MKLLVVNSLRKMGGGEEWLLRMAAEWRGSLDLHLAAPPAAPLLQRGAAAGASAYPVPMRHDISPAAIFGLAALVRRLHPDLVLLCTERAVRLGCAASFLAGGPRLIFRDGLIGSFKNRSINRLCIRRLSAIVANAPEIAAELNSFGWIPPHLLRVIENGVAIEPSPVESRQEIRDELGLSRDGLAVLTVARLEAEKGIGELLEAVRLMPADAWEVLLIAGEGARRSELEAQARSAGIAGRVRFLGYRSDVRALMRAADLFTLPSHREGRSNALLEAMAAGLPIAATAVGGTPSLIEDGISGCLVPPGSPGALAAILQKLISDPARRRALGEAAQRRAAQFSLQAEAAAWLELFHEMQRMDYRKASASAESA